MRITWDNIEEILKQLDKASCVRYAIFCAEQVKHLNADPAVDAAIGAAKDWLASPSEKNADAARTVADAVYCIDYTAYATAYAAANAAYAATAAYYAADAAYCTYAACAADINREQIKQEQVNYLKQLYLESLPEDERNCWLVQAAIGV